MSDQSKIQRSPLDAATEITVAYVQKFSSAPEIEKVTDSFKEIYKTVMKASYPTNETIQKNMDSL